jgi:6-phosphogluconolactonase
MCQNKLNIYADVPAMAQCAFHKIVEIVRKTLQRHNTCRIALSGGSTPDALFKLFADDAGKSIPWAKIELFWVDERLVPFDSEYSNYGRARKLFIEPLNLSTENLHPIQPEKEGPAACYAAELQKACSDRFDDGIPVFDLMLMGMGSDGHTASLFPDSEALTETKQAVLEVPPPSTVQPQVPRITLTLPVINRSENIIFMVSGQEKIALLRYIDTLEVIVYPVQLIRKDKTCWLASE